MNNSKVESLCGKRAVKGKPGTKGMATGDIEKFIKTSIPTAIRPQFTRLQKKDRFSMCKILALYKEGQDLLKLSRTPSPVKKVASPSKNDPFAMMQQMAGPSVYKTNALKRLASKKGKSTKFQLMNENGEVESGSNGNSPNKTNIYTANNNKNQSGQQFAYKANWASIRRAEPDPLNKKVKVRGRTKAILERQMRKLQKGGKLPESTKQSNVLKSLLLMKPGNKGKKARNAASTSYFRPMSKVEKKQRIMMKLNGGASKTTGSKRTNSKLAVSKVVYSPSQVKNARARANTVLNRLNRAGLLPNLPNGSPESAKRKLEREMKNLKATLLNSQLALVVPKTSPKKVKTPTFNMGGKTVFVSNKLAQLKRMKAGEKTRAQKRMQRMLQKTVSMVPKKPKYSLIFAPNALKTPNASPNGSPNKRSNGSANGLSSGSANGSPKAVKRGMQTTISSVQKLKNKQARGIKLTQAESRLLNVYNAINKQRA